MVTQTIEIFSEWPDEANTVCRARHKETRALIASSAVLDAPDPSGVVYLPQFTNLPADEYFFTHETSTGQLMSYGYATVTLTTATFRLYGVRASELPATAVGLSNSETSIVNAVEVVGDSVSDARSEIDVVAMTTTAIRLDTFTTIPGILGTPAGDDIAADIAAVKSDTGNLVTRITDTLFDGITSLAAWLGALAGKTADTDTRAEINATTAGANYNETTDSQEATVDRGNAAWTGGGGGSNPVTIPITVIGAAEGELITIKAKCAVTLAFTLPSAPTLGTYILGISDDSGQSLLKVFGTLDGVVLTFAITSKDAARLYEGTHSYDIIEVSGYNADTDDYTDAALIAGAKHGVVVLPLYVSPLG